MRDDILKWAESRLAARRVASKHNASELTVQGHVDGAPVSVSASRSSRGHWATMTLNVPALPVLLELRRRERSDSALVARGAIRAVTIGAPELDATWLLEAAPVAIARELVDAAVRSGIASLPACTVTVDQGSLQLFLAAAGSIDNDGLEAMLGFALTFRARMIAVHQERRARQVDETVERAEVEKLRALQDRLWARASWPSRVGIVVLIVMLTAAALAFVRYSFFPS